MIRFAAQMLCLLLAALISSAVDAQRIYVLAVGDTSEKSGLSFSTGPDLQYLFDAFYVNVPGGQLINYNHPMADFADGSSRTLANPWEGPDVRGDLVDMKNKMLHAIDLCPATNNDTIVVFYSGHGAYDDQGHFLVMPDGKTRLHRKTLLDQIALKGPRLAVLITDSCNLHVPSGMPVSPSAMLIPPARISPLFETLFVRSRGVVDVNSSSEAEVSIGAIGGGLLTLSLAYLGNQPNFRPFPEFRRPERSPLDAVSDAEIPSIDHSLAMEEFFGVLTEHGLHGNFDPNLPAFGVMFAYADQSLDWKTVSNLLTKKVDTLFKTIAPGGWDTGKDKQTTQTPRFYSLPTLDAVHSQAVPQGAATGRWSQPIYRPEIGDRIVEINGQPIRNMVDYVHAVKTSTTTMTFRLWEARTGKTFTLRTQLNPPQSDSRFGVGATESSGGGVRVQFIMAGYPGTRCQLAE